MSLETSASESEEKDVNECMFAGKMCLTDCGVENCAMIVLILLMKNVESRQLLELIQIQIQIVYCHCTYIQRNYKYANIPS